MEILEFGVVRVSADEVHAFKKRWPCSGLPDGEITFTFDSKGDLVDLDPYEIDGPAVAALSQDALEYLESERVPLNVDEGRI